MRMTVQINYPGSCKLPEPIVQAGKEGQLVLFVGAGASMRVGLPSWPGLASRVLDDLRNNGILNYAELDQLKELDAKKQLSIASDLAEQKRFTLDYRKYLGEPNDNSDIYQYLNSIGCPCVTTNYDELLKPIISGGASGNAAPKTGQRFVNCDDMFAAHLDKAGSVIHLHGALSEQGTIVATTKSYLELYDKERTQQFLKDLFSQKVVLFIGYGLEEAEILEHILRRGNARKTEELKRYALQGFFTKQNTLFEQLHRYYTNAFGLELIGFARDVDDYEALDKVLMDWSGRLKINEPTLADSLALMEEVLANE